MYQFDNEYLTKEMINARQEWVLTFLFNKYYKRLRKYAVYMLRDSFSVDDIVQDIFLRFWYKMGNNTAEFITNEMLENYFFMSVRMECINLLKRNQRYINTVIEEADQDMFNDIATAERMRTLMGLIKFNKLLMPQQMQSVMIKFLIEGKRLIEVCKEMHLTRQAVLTQRRLGVKILKDYFIHGKLASIQRLTVYNSKINQEKKDKLISILKANRKASTKYLAYECGISYGSANILRKKFLSEDKRENRERLMLTVETLTKKPDITLNELALALGLKGTAIANYWKKKGLEKINNEAALGNKLRIA